MTTLFKNIAIFALCAMGAIAPVFSMAQPQADGSYKSAEDPTYYGEVPARNGHYVHDVAKILSGETVRQLEEQLKNHEGASSNQIDILTIPNIMIGLDSYADKVFNTWRPKQGGKNSVLILVNVERRTVITRVSEGLDVVLTNSLRSTIIEDDMAPSFSGKDYNAGMIAGVSGIIKVIDGTYTDDKYFYGRLFLFIVYGIAVIVSLVALFFKDYMVPAFSVLLPFHLLFSYFTGIWWVVLAFLVGFPLLRFLVVKSKIKLWAFKIDEGKREQDAYDVMTHRHYTTDSSSDSSDDGGSSDGSGRW